MTIFSPTTSVELTNILLSVDHTAFIENIDLLKSLGFEAIVDSSAYLAVFDNYSLKVFLYDNIITIKEFYNNSPDDTVNSHRDNDLPSEIHYDQIDGYVTFLGWRIDGNYKRENSDKKELYISIHNSICTDETRYYYDGSDESFNNISLFRISFKNNTIIKAIYTYKDYEFILPELVQMLPFIDFPVCNTVDDYYDLGKKINLTEEYKKLLEIILFD